jgi:putative ABC transport system substrate-binding protein
MVTSNRDPTSGLGATMIRRDFITLIGGAAAAWPLAAKAQRPDRVRRVGVLMSVSEPEFERRFKPFRDELVRVGWTEPRNLRIDYRWTDNKPDLALARARELLDLAPEVIFAAPGPMVEVLQRLTRTIPIVFSTNTNPVDAGYVRSYAHPGGNITGFTQVEGTVAAKWLQLIKDVAPQLRRVGVLRPAELARGRRDFDTAKAAAESLAVTPVDLPLDHDDPAEIERVIEAFAQEPSGGLIVPPSGSLLEHRVTIVRLAERHRLPAVYFNRLFADTGGLMSYGIDQLDVFRQAATYVDRILRGEKPGDLPVQAATKYELVVNLKAAKSLGLMISHDFLLSADEVIE